MGGHRSDLQSFGRWWRRALIILLLLLPLAGLVFFWPASPPAFPPVVIHFTGEVSDVHVHQFGRFTITNVSGRALDWSRGKVEAPTDPVLWLSETLDSNGEFGRLPPNASTNFRALVPKGDGAPFRVMVGYSYEPERLDRLREKVSRHMPWVGSFWPVTNRLQVLTSQWFHASTDYARSTNVNWSR